MRQIVISTASTVQAVASQNTSLRASCTESHWLHGEQEKCSEVASRIELKRIPKEEVT